MNDFISDLSPTVTSIPPPTADAPSLDDQPTGGAAAATATSEATETKIVDVVMVLGGMDTEGEIFEDALILVTHEHDTEERGAEPWSDFVHTLIPVRLNNFLPVGEAVGLGCISEWSSIQALVIILINKK